MRTASTLNHRVVVLQHKCIEPLGESKSDYQIFTRILQPLGLGAIFSEGCSDLDWVKRVFDSSDLPQHMSWKEFCSKGYFVVPAEAESDARPGLLPLVRGRAAEGHPRAAAAAVAVRGRASASGLQTPSRASWSSSRDICAGDPDNPERPVVNRYIPSWEGPRQRRGLFQRFPLQMIATHSRYSFHTHCDGKDSAINDIDDHRVRVDGHDFWVLRMNDDDARERGIRHHDLVKVCNDRGAVICAADVSPHGCAVARSSRSKRAPNSDRSRSPASGSRSAAA